MDNEGLCRKDDDENESIVIGDRVVIDTGGDWPTLGRLIGEVVQASTITTYQTCGGDRMDRKEPEIQINRGFRPFSTGF
ncbi:MAG: hypothetical protein FWG62_04935 [Proteobacteria bacterium]|nr:hypothetical protein [Pseudomonadota bacterium]